MVDVIEGGSGADVLQGTRLPEVIYGGEGDDIINPGLPSGAYNPETGGPDIAYGGAGNDRIFLTLGAYEAIYGGDGADRLELPVYNPRTGSGWSLADDHFFGGAGEDSIYFRGAESYDAHRSSSHSEYAISLLEGTVESRLVFSNFFEASPWRLSLTFSEVEHATGASGADLLTGDHGSNQLDGRGGNDVIDGQGGDDKLFGGLGDDLITDGAGRDRLFGGQGADTFVLRLDGEVDSIKDFEDGRDRIDLTAWNLDRFDALSVSAHHKPGKVVVRAGDEVLAVQGSGLRATDLDESDFLFGQV